MALPRRLSRRLAAATPLALWLAALPAAAHSVSDEASIGFTQQNNRNPRTGFLADSLRGTLTLSDALSFRLGVTLTHDNPSPPAKGTRWGDTGGNIFAALLGVDWTVNDHVGLGAELDGSPPNIQRNGTTVEFLDAQRTTATADALLKATSSSEGALLSFSYDTAGDSDTETAVDFSVAGTRFDTGQSLARIEQNGVAVTAQQVREQCAAATTSTQLATCRALRPALRGEDVTLAQLVLKAAVTETLFTDTDVTLGGAWYLYDQDPTQVGYFSTLALGRSQGLQFGSGVPLSPQLFVLRPELFHRFGPFWVSGWYQYTRYVDNEGDGHGLGLKLQYTLGKRVRLWASGTWQRDLQPAEPSATGAARNQVTVSSSGAAGVKISW